MKAPLICSLVLTATQLVAHDLTPRWVTPSGHVLTGEFARLEMEAVMNRMPEPPPGPAWSFVATQETKAPAQAAPFAKFAPAVKTRWDEQFLFIESNGLPAHNMMVGITAWQQQVPLPQNYTGANAWRLPLVPVPAKEPASIRDRFLRGAIAIAANGIPIFNPQNNRGEISADIGELDEWGGHCGRADDYHYHAAPLHLQKALGTKWPIAYALDGYPIYGLTEPDGSQPKGLDAFNGHSSPELGYHYHASKTWPFVNGGFHGEVVEREGQVDPQPRATPVRPALQALRGARITGFSTSADGKERKLVYQVAGKEASVVFAEAAGGAWRFVFTGTDGKMREENYRPDERGGRDEGGRQPRDGQRRDGRPPSQGQERAPRPQGERTKQGGATSAEMDALKKPLAGFVLTSPEIPDPAKLPVEFTGDGKGVSPPFAWRGAPAGTKSFAVVMDHLTPDATIKTYWTMWDIPATAAALPKDARDIGKLGTSFRGSTGYEPPKSQGPGAKTYIVTLYALSEATVLNQPPREVTRETLLAAMKGKVLGSAMLRLTCTRDVASASSAERRGGPHQEGDRPSGGRGGRESKPVPAPSRQP